MDGMLNMAALTVTVPIWHVVTGGAALISFGAGLAWLIYNVRQSVTSNIDQNNRNHITQMQALAKQSELLEQIICLTQMQLYAIGKPDFRYEGECERNGR